VARALRILVIVMGVTCVVIGLVHVAAGIASVPGEAHSGATVDSRERFYGVLFAAYGGAWLWAGRRAVLPVDLVRALAAVMFLGGIARLLSIAVNGAPQWFQTVLLVVELVVPVVFVVLTPRVAVADARPTSHRRSEVAQLESHPDRRSESRGPKRSALG